MESAERNSVLTRCALAAAFCVTVLLIVPFNPLMPVLDLDVSWAYALNEALVRHLVFGRDIVFTFGPLASVYTQAYHPAVDRITIGFSAFFAVAIFAGVMSIARRQNILLCAIYPLCISQTRLFDSVFITLPVIFLAVVVQQLSDDKKAAPLDRTALALLLTAVSMLPLIKVSFTSALLPCSAAALFVVARRSAWLAAAMAAWGLAVMALVWTALGQPFAALPYFFVAQGPIISGYAEGMSLDGSIFEILVYLIGAMVFAVAFSRVAVRRYGWNGVALSLAIAAVLFVGFKAGFIRQYGHSQLAAAIMLLMGCIAVTLFGLRTGAVCATACLVPWLCIMPNWQLTDPYNVVARAVTNVTWSVEGLWKRATQADGLISDFAKAKARMRAASTLPVTAGTVDAYPSDLGSIFANDQRWDPRPVLQSYSAYTASLLKANVSHLEGPHAPDRIYFDIDPIDNRYPSIEDAESWTALMSRYQVAGAASHFVVLDRRAQSVALDVQPLGDRVAPVGSSVSIPGEQGPIWAKIDVRPTFLGRIVAMLFKPPVMSILVHHADGSDGRYRFIPSIGRQGFLLSPTVSSRADFAALMEGKTAPTSARVTVVGISGESGTHLLWGDHYSVSLYSIR